jgi:hypothetical protein
MDRTNFDSAEVQTSQRAVTLPAKSANPKKKATDRRCYRSSLATDPSR